jgi:hypothetical protein
VFIPTHKLSTGPGHPFYAKLNEVLGQAHFDKHVKDLCAPHDKDGGRPGIPPIRDNLRGSQAMTGAFKEMRLDISPASAYSKLHAQHANCIVEIP